MRAIHIRLDNVEGGPSELRRLRLDCLAKEFPVTPSTAQVCARRGVDSCGHSYPDRLSVGLSYAAWQ